jgi:ubiquinone/menaquinone biosynthesis C-methylase UbiE
VRRHPPNGGNQDTGLPTVNLGSGGNHVDWVMAAHPVGGHADAMANEHADAGRSFGDAAELYDRLRYTPGDEVLAWLLAGQEGGQVLDLASGTGQIARRLSDDFAGPDGAVFALEPDPRMRSVLRARVPRATVIDGTAESIPLATASIDTVLVGSAWHWFNQSPAPAEIARVLRDGGVLGVLGTTPDISVDWVRDLFIPEDLRLLERAQQAYVNARLPSGDFGPVAYASFGGRQSVGREDVAESFKTHSYYRTAGPQRRAAIVAQVHTALDAHFPGVPTIELATRTLCWRARRTRQGGGS